LQIFYSIHVALFLSQWSFKTLVQLTGTVRS